MSNKKIPRLYESAIEIYIDKFNLYIKEYKYIGKDKDGLYLYDDIPNYDKERNVFSLLSEKCTSYIKNSEYNTNVEEDILRLFKDGEIILISEGIERIGGLIIINEETPVDKLFKLLSEVQGIEIKPYDRFDIKTADNITLGSHYLDENFKRYSSNGIREYNEDTLRGILTGEMKILKCKKAVVLTEDDIICLKYYLKNGYGYIVNNKYFEGIESYDKHNNDIDEDSLKINKNITIMKNKYTLNKVGPYWKYIAKTEEEMFKPNDKLSFIHYYYPEIWDIEKLLEQERVSND